MVPLQPSVSAYGVSTSHPAVNCAPEHLGVSLAHILVLAGAASAGRMTPPASTRISARLNYFKEQSSPVNVVPASGTNGPTTVNKNIGSAYSSASQDGGHNMGVDRRRRSNIFLDCAMVLRVGRDSHIACSAVGC